MEIFSQEGWSILARWGHFLAGITWIGLLYYFNLVQVPSFAQFDAGARTEAIRKLVPRALWWFRWGALATVIAGILILLIEEIFPGQSDFRDFWGSLSGVSIYTGALLGLVMLANVWGVIWPNQRILIASAEATAAGGQPDPNAAAAGRRAFVASRTNVVLSIPMLFFMGATSHFAPAAAAGDLLGSIGAGEAFLYWILLIIVIAVIEANALGAFMGVGPHPLRKPLETVQYVIAAGLVLAVVWYIVGWEIILRE